MRGFQLKALLAAGLTLLVGCTMQSRWDAVYTLVRTTFPDVEQLSTESVAALLADSSSNVILLDVREESEYAISHLPGARRVDPNGDPEALLKELGLGAGGDAGSAGTPRIITYCSVGYRSSDMAGKLAEALQSNGAESTRISNLEGSIFKWANEERPLVSSEGPVTKVHPFDRTWGKLVDPRFRAEPGNGN